jgi:hypothetical protein
MPRRAAGVALSIAILVATVSCRLTDPCSQGSPTLYFEPLFSELWVGDSHPLGAILFNTHCEEVIGSSADSPGEFTFTTSNAAIVRIDPNRTLTAVDSGTATIEVKHAGYIASMKALVTVPIASARIVITPATVARGDVVTARVEALDASGAVIANARVWGFQVINRSSTGTRAITYEPGRPSEYRFPAEFSGEYEMVGQFNRTGHPRVATTRTFAVP